MTMKTGTPKKPRSRRKPVREWHLVTNHQNMLYILAAGMVMSPAGFRDKHYSDPLDVYPGWIPLFPDKEKIPPDVFSYAVSERKHLFPCIASFNLSDLSGPVRMLSRDGHIRDIASPTARKCKGDIALLVSAPLPLTWLLSVNFRSPDDKQAFENAAKDVSNVDLSSAISLTVETASFGNNVGSVGKRIPGIIGRVKEWLFPSNMEVAWPTEQPQGRLLEDGSDRLPAFGQTLGGVVAMLYHTANHSDLGLAAYRLVTKAAHDKDNDLVREDPILAELSGWMDGGEVSEQADTRARLFWGVIQSLVDVQIRECPQTPIDVAIAYLESQLDLLPEMKLRSRLERLIEDMRGVLGLGGGTIGELLERHKGPLSRPLLLFCLREHCTDLLEFSHPSLRDAEYLLASILFGARDSWLQFPRELRNPGLSAYVSFRMAEAEHRKRDESFAMSAPPRLQPLRELVILPGSEWGNMQQEAAEILASECNWNDCFRTSITLAKSDDLPKSFEREGLQVVFPSRIEASVRKFDKDKFLHRLRQWPPIATQIESKVREKLAGATEKPEQTAATIKNEDDTEPALDNR